MNKPVDIREFRFHRIDEIALSRELKQLFKTCRLDLPQRVTDVFRRNYKFAEKPFDVVDQVLRGGSELVRFGNRQIDVSLQAGHESLSTTCHNLKSRQNRE